MYSRITKLIVLIALASIISYLFYYNPQTSTIHFGSQSEVQIPTALVLIVSFFVGVIMTTIFAIYLGLKLKFEKWGIEKKLRQQDTHYHELQKAADLLYLEDTAGARSTLQKIISKDATDTLARLALSRTYNIDGQSSEAIHVLEQARADQKRSPAILIELAQSFEKNGNKSAALDNILLCLKEHPKSMYVLSKAIRLAEQMGRLEEAEKLALELLKICPYSEQHKIQEQLAQIKLEKISPLAQKDPEEYVNKLQELIKIHKDYEPAVIALAQVYINNNEANTAIKSLQKIVKKGTSFEAAQALVSFWLKSNNPQSAIQLLEEIISNGKDSLKKKASLLLAQIYLKLENIEQAEKIIREFEDETNFDSDEYRLIEILKVKLESKIPGRGKTNATLEKLIEKESKRSGVLGMPLEVSSIQDKPLTRVGEA